SGMEAGAWEHANKGWRPTWNHRSPPARKSADPTTSENLPAWILVEEHFPV
ncbi:hypothetical protein KI387_032744, partial [Taxus chinensis]